MSQPYPEQHYPEQRQQQPPSSQPGTPGQLVLNLRKPFDPLSASLITPKATIDGYPAPVRWEQNQFPVTPGQHHLHLSATYLWEYGAADQTVQVAPGQSVEVHYSPPLITFLRGRIGFERQPLRGLAVFWVVVAIPVLLVIVAVVGLALSS